MNRTKSIFAAISVSIIMSLLAACGGGGGAAVPSDVPTIAGMKQADDSRGGTDKPLLGDDGFVKVVGMKFDTTGNFNWSHTYWESPKPLDETTTFYSKEALQAAGWNAPDMPECITADGASICLVAKPSGDTFTVLAVGVLNMNGKVIASFLRIEGMKVKAQ